MIAVLHYRHFRFWTVRKGANIDYSIYSLHLDGEIRRANFTLKS